MSYINGEAIRFGQHQGDDIDLTLFGDEFYARYETRDGFTVVYDTEVGAYCYADLAQGYFVSTGARADKPAPPGIRRHLKEAREIIDPVIEDPENGFPSFLVLRAGCRVKDGDPEGALEDLRQAIEDGYQDRETLENEPLLEPLRGVPGFVELIDELIPEPEADKGEQDEARS